MKPGKWQLKIIEMKNEKLENNELMSFAMHYALVHSHDGGEVNMEPSLTQPDDVLSIAEMLHNHVRGLPLDMAHEFDLDANDSSVDHFIPDPASMDLVERMEFAKQQSEEAKQLLAKAQTEAGEHKKKLQEEKETFEDFKKFRKKQKESDTDSE